MSDLEHGGVPAVAAPLTFSFGRHAPDDPPPLAPAPNLDTVETETRHYRHDGWTPAARAAFLDMLAKSGVVTDACREVQRSSQTAYALRNRDRLFAAGWDAALSMARARLADELFHRAINGTVDQIWKDGAIVAERHRHDNRLSIAVLTRLDSRCDRAERIGAPTQRLAAQWDAWLAALAEDRTADAEAMLDPPSPTPVAAVLGQGSDSTLIHQFHQLRSGQALDQRVWIEHGAWRTNYPPPEHFDGDEDGDYGDDDYDRSCTPDERELLDLRCPTAFDDERATSIEADEAERDAYFTALADEFLPLDGDPPSPAAHPELVEGSTENGLPILPLRQALGERNSDDESSPAHCRSP